MKGNNLTFYMIVLILESDEEVEIVEGESPNCSLRRKMHPNDRRKQLKAESDDSSDDDDGQPCHVVISSAASGDGISGLIKKDESSRNVGGQRRTVSREDGKSVLTKTGGKVQPQDSRTGKAPVGRAVVRGMLEERPAVDQTLAASLADVSDVFGTGHFMQN